MVLLVGYYLCILAEVIGMTESTCIMAAGEQMDVGTKVVLWSDPNGFSFYKNKSYKPRDLSLDDLRKQIKCFVLHHSATYTAKHCYQGLNSRGLSVNFMIDDDCNENGYATIYQCLDIKDIGWSQGSVNSLGPGVEICYQPAAWNTPNAYSEVNQKKYGVQPHSPVRDKIHGVSFSVFPPTEAQIKSTIALMTGFCKLFPDVKPEFPKTVTGGINKTTVGEYTGMISHFNITKSKVDPMGFPFERAEEELKKNLNVEEPKGWFKKCLGYFV